LPAGVLRLVPVAHDAVVVNLAVDTHARRVIVQSGDVSHARTLSVLDAATGRTLQAVPIGAYPASHVFVDERHGRAFALTFGLNPATGRLATGRLATGRLLLASIPLRPGISCVPILPVMQPLGYPRRLFL